MELYKTLKEAVNSTDFKILHWEFQKSDNVFDRNAMLILADELEPTFNPEGLNYYMALPDGEILLLEMRDKVIVSLFVPYQMPVKKPEPTPAAAPNPTPNSGVRFCSECGTPLKPGARFCSNCGNSVKR